MTSINTKKSISIDNTSGSIIVSENKFLKLNENGGVLIGDNSNILDGMETEIPKDAELYKGVIVYSKLLNRLQFWDGTQWQTLLVDTDTDDTLITWSLTF